MSVCPIADLDDARAEPYRGLKDRELAKHGDRFIAEGELVVRRLIESGLAIESVLLAERRVAEIAPLVPPGVPIYAAPDAMMKGILGFKFHSGVIACGRRPPSPELGDLMAGLVAPRRPLTLVVCPQVLNHDNLGALLRIAAAFGVDAFLIGERSSDPYWRRSIRVSMGAVFKLPVVRSRDLAADLERLRREWQVEAMATVLGGDAEDLAGAWRPVPPRLDRLALLFGPEDRGLDEQWLGLCQRRVTIPMALGVDSLNLAAAAAVVLYHFTRCARAPAKGP